MSARYRLTRRRFVQGAGVAGLALVAGCGRLPGQAQPARVFRIAYLIAGPRPTGATPPFDTAFLEGLHEHGLVENQNVAIDYRYAGGLDGLPEVAAAVVDAGPDVVVTSNAQLVAAVKNATTTIPIVGLTMANPVESGLIDSLSRPGGNVTGLTSDTGAGFRTKRLGLLKEVAPGMSRLTVLWDPVEPSGPSILAETQDAAPKLGIEVHSAPVRNESEFDRVFDAILRTGSDAMDIIGGPRLIPHRKRIADFAIEHRLVSATARREMAEAGILLVYGPSFDDLARRGGFYVDKILKGARPADLPVEQPREFECLINLRTAQALGLTIPQHVLLQATEVIQ